MDIIKEDAFRKMLKKGISGGFFFFGDEDYMKGFALRAAREAVCPDETFAVFNDVRIDSLNYSASALLDAIIPPPMMTDMKIVTVSGINLDAMKTSEMNDLCEALEELKNYDYNLLIISVPAGQVDLGYNSKYPSENFKRLAKYLTPVQFDAISGARLVSWVGKHFEHNGVNAAPEVCSELINYCGRSMFVLSEETAKLAYYVLWNGRQTVTSDDIKNVSIAEISADTYALANAIADGRYEDALKALSVMKFHRVEPVIVLSDVSKTICEITEIKLLKDQGLPFAEIMSAFNENKKKKISDYRMRIYLNSVSNKSISRLRRAVTLCSEADLALKSSYSNENYAPIERLICSL